MVHPANQRFQILFLPRVAYHRTTGTFILFFCFRIRLKVFIPGEGRGSWHYSDEKERKKKRKKGRKEKGNQRHCTCKVFKHASTAVSSIKWFLGQDLNMVIFRQFPDIFGGIRAEHCAQKFDSTNSASLRGRQDKKIYLFSVTCLS